MTIKHELMEILACPQCKGRLAEQGDFLICHPCGLRYPVRDGIPVLLLEEAQRGTAS
jgi:uncharacterized protein